MIEVDIHLFTRLSLLGFCAGVGGLYGLTFGLKFSECQQRFVFEDFATRRDKARVYFQAMREWYDPEWRPVAIYTLGWGAAGAILFALVTLLLAGIGEVFL